jgi:hypothetical protein
VAAYAPGALPVSVPALADLDENSGTVRLVRLVASIKLMGLTVQPPADGSGEAKAELVQVVTAPLPHVLWVEECLRQLSSHARAITGPAWDMAEQRRLPWWR